MLGTAYNGDDVTIGVENALKAATDSADWPTVPRETVHLTELLKIQSR